MPDFDPRSRILFPDQPRFTPYYSPKQLFELGVAGGNLLVRTRSRDGLPHRFVHNVPEAAAQMYTEYNVSRNKFGAEPIPLIHPGDAGLRVRNWLLWYIRFYYGARSKGQDDLQIQRWHAHVIMMSKLTYQLYDSSNQMLPHGHNDYLQTTLELAWNPKIQFFGNTLPARAHSLTDIDL